MLINMDGNTLNGQLTSEVVICLVEHWYKLIEIHRAFIKSYFLFQTCKTIIIIWTGTVSTLPVGLPTQICTRLPSIFTCRLDVPYLFIQSKDNGNTSLHPSLSHSIALIPFIILIIRNFITNVNVLVTFYGFGETRKHSVNLTDPRNSSGGRQIIIWRPPEELSGGRQKSYLAAAR